MVGRCTEQSRLAGHDILGPSLESDSESLAWTQTAPRGELLSPIAARTLVLVGEQTQPLMSTAAESIAAHRPHARAETLPAANHSWEPAVMADRLAGFLSEPDTGAF